MTRVKGHRKVNAWLARGRGSVLREMPEPLSELLWIPCLRALEHLGHSCGRASLRTRTLGGPEQGSARTQALKPQVRSLRRPWGLDFGAGADLPGTPDPQCGHRSFKQRPLIRQEATPRDRPPLEAKTEQTAQPCTKHLHVSRQTSPSEHVPSNVRD